MSEGKQLPMLRPEKAPGQAPIFQRVGIVGLGLIGGSIALAARQIWPASLVIGVDRKDVLERAMVLHAIDVAADDAVVLAEADLVILAAPIQHSVPANPLSLLDTGARAHTAARDVEKRLRQLRPVSYRTHQVSNARAQAR